MPTPPLIIRLRHSPAFAAQSHGWCRLAPFDIDGDRMDWAVRLPKGGARQVTIGWSGKSDALRVTIPGTECRGQHTWEVPGTPNAIPLSYGWRPRNSPGRARTNGARAWRRRFSEAAGEETWPCVEAAETRPEEGLKWIVVYAVPGTSPRNFPPGKFQGHQTQYR